ncbi:tetratricopeptide repeat protein [Altererythrobacter sp. Z27]|uniref:tetratricopeptide repeat protein n=1 Tax=Altererythrobacter sp. Z27 TaxID=3461147 RepID=UPI004044815B
MHGKTRSMTNSVIPLMDQAELDAALDRLIEVPFEEREARLQGEFADRPEMQVKLSRLLHMEGRSRDLFARLESQRMATLAGLFREDGKGESGDPRIGRCYGPWKVVAHRGSGGLAEVYEVCRADGRYEQRAALKILRNGIIGPVARELFLRERRLLASLDHPGIVRIIDGGETDTGAPWLAMELVEGLPIDQYCKQNDVDIRRRLGLLADAADIVSAAHARMVVHGDLKAEHILVTPGGKLRLLDFGIAQALDERAQAERPIGELDGGHAALVFTPDYASPEQSAGRSLSAASDIYQMGLIAGQLVPSDHQDRALTAVIAKAIAREPQDRYASMTMLAGDLRALVADVATMALPDSRRQTLQRAVRHNRLAAALAVLVVIGSVGWTLTTALSSAAISRERNAAVTAADRERRGKDVLLQLFRRADLLEADSLGLEPAAAAAMLDEALADARQSVDDDPVLLADLINWAARAHLRAGNQDKARALAEEELTVIQSSSKRGTLREGAAQAFLGNILANSGDAEEADRRTAAALAILEEAGGTVDPLALDLLLATAWASEGDWQRQRGLFERALMMAETLGDPKSELEVRSGLGRALTGLGEFDPARAELAKALTLVDTLFGARHLRRALPLSDLGRLEDHAGNPAAAISYHREALAISDAVLGADHRSTLAHRNNLANALMAAGQADAAIDEYQQLLELHGDGLARGEVAQNLGAALVQRGDFGRADEMLTLAERAFSTHLPPDHPRRAFPALTRSEMRLAQRRWTDADRDARSALALLEKALPNGHFATETARCRVGMALLGMGRKAQAADHIQPALAALIASGNAAPARYVEPCRGAAKLL